MAHNDKPSVMPLSMPAAVAKAREHAAVDAIYQRVDAITPITIREVEGPQWTSVIKGGVTIIEAGAAQDPAAALFHELLHADLKNRGYRQHSVLVVINEDARKAQGFIEAFDNELQHHRMYGHFVAENFAASAFYSDDDKSSFRKIREQLRKMKGLQPARELLLPFLTIIAPGGHGDGEERRKLRNFLFSKGSEETRGVLESIEQEIAAWAQADTLDPGGTLKTLFALLGFEGLWIGVSQHFPADGFFVGSPFDMSAAQAFASSRR